MISAIILCSLKLKNLPYVTIETSDSNIRELEIE